MNPAIPSDRIRGLSGFGMALRSDGYVYTPRTPEEIAEVFALARSTDRQVVLRGAARSYGDASIGRECLVMDLTSMNRILSFDAKTGIVEVEPGVTLADIWRRTLPEGWWLPVVSGTMKTTVGGALAMNIHGKNNFLRGPLGEHVVELDIALPNRELRTVTPADELFYAIISGLGLLGVITRAKIALKRVLSGNVQVEAISCANWDEQFAAFEKFEGKREYVVSWIDCFARGTHEGRGILHAASHVETEDRHSLQVSSQDLPPKIMGFFPKSSVWRVLKLMNNSFGMKGVNAAKHQAGIRTEHGKTYTQSLAKYNFLLDYVPGWEKAYLPGGLIQCQYFVPLEEAKRTFHDLVAIQQAERLESFLAVMKRHRPDKFLLSHAVDGYSLALDFKVTAANRTRLFEMSRRMNDLALSRGGRFYFAKDSALTPPQAAEFLGDALTRFREIKAELDPEGLLTSDLAKRLKLVG